MNISELINNTKELSELPFLPTYTAIEILIEKNILREVLPDVGATKQQSKK